jgi:hypothetical protein
VYSLSGCASANVGRPVPSSSTCIGCRGPRCVCV